MQMNAMTDWIGIHPVLAFLIYIAYMSLVQALPRPAETSSVAYVTAYRFMHLFAANIKLFTSPRKNTLVPVDLSPVTPVAEPEKAPVQATPEQK